MSEWGEDWDQQSAAPATAPEKAAEPQLVYGSVNEFFRDFLRFAYRRTIVGRGSSGPFWDPQWWKYDEAVMRLEAVWREWESARQSPTGMSPWWRDHVDHHMPVLMSSAGPFGRSKVETEPGDPLPHEEPPEGMFPDQRDDVA